MVLAVFVSRIFELSLNTKPERRPPLINSSRTKMSNLFFNFCVKNVALTFFNEGRRKNCFPELPMQQKLHSLWNVWWQKICKYICSFLFFFSGEMQSNNLTMTLKCVWMCTFRSYLVNSLTCQWFLFMWLVGCLQRDNSCKEGFELEAFVFVL